MEPEWLHRSVLSPATVSTVGTGLQVPQAVAQDGAGDTYIADKSLGIVRVAGGGSQTTVGGGIGDAAGVAVDGAGNVFIVDEANGLVAQVPAGGGAQTTVVSSLSSPSGAAIDGLGNLYVADSGNNRVLKVEAGTGNQISLGSNLNSPHGVAVDAAGDVFIAAEFRSIGGIDHAGFVKPERWFRQSASVHRGSFRFERSGLFECRIRAVQQSVSAANGCYVLYLPQTNQLYLKNDAGTANLGPLTPGVAGQVSNSTCTLAGTGSSYTTSGNTGTLTVELSFASTAVNNVYLYAADKMSGNTGFVQKGNWGISLAAPVIDVAESEQRVGSEPGFHNGDYRFEWRSRFERDRSVDQHFGERGARLLHAVFPDLKSTVLEERCGDGELGAADAGRGG